MAKQNVTFVERHVEKFVVGVAGLVLLGSIVLYGVGSPNKVSVDGADLGPKDVFGKLKEKAESARLAARSKPVGELPPLPHLASRGSKSVHEGAGLPLTYMAGGYVPNPAVPVVSGLGSTGDIVLASILPPKAVTVREGRAFAPLPPPQIIRLGLPDQSPPPTDQSPVPRDYHWALVIAGLDRKAQAAEFAKAKYEEKRCQLVVAEVQAERRKLEDGKWSEPERVTGFAQRAIKGESRIKPTAQDNGPAIFAETELLYVETAQKQLYAPEIQSEILRPTFQSFLESKQLAWQPPKTLPGFEFKLSEFGVAFPADEGKSKTLGPRGPEGPRAGIEPPGGRGPRAAQPPPGPGPTPGAVDVAARNKVRALIAKAKKGFESTDYEQILKANDSLEEALNAASQAQLEKDRKDIEALRKDHEAKIVEAQNKRNAEDKRRQEMGVVKLGADQEPMWLTDVNVEPGATYQYRLRVVAFNEYAGKPGRLKDREDAQRVFLEGQWSEWSEPITIYPAVQMFFTEAREEAGSKKARVTVWQWAKGKWDKAEDDLEVGRPVSLAKGADKFNYDGIVTGLDNGREYRPRIERTGGKVDYGEPVKTDVLTLVSSAGQVEERLMEEDKVKLRMHRDFMEKEKKLLASAVDQPTAGPARPGDFGPRPMPGMDMRGRGFGDPRMGRGRGDPRMMGGPGGPDPRYNRGFPGP